MVKVSLADLLDPLPPWLQQFAPACGVVLSLVTHHVIGPCFLFACIGFTLKVAVYSNVRTTIGAQRSGWSEAFNVAFRAGSVLGYALTGMAILVLYIALWGFRQHFTDSGVRFDE